MSILNDDWSYCHICGRHILDDSLDCDKIYHDEDGNCLCEECKTEEDL